MSPAYVRLCHQARDRLGDGSRRGEIERLFVHALQPAPELRVISQHVVNTIHSHLHRAPRTSLQPLGGVGGVPGLGRLLGPSKRRLAASQQLRDFNCLHVRRSDLSSIAALKSAAGPLAREAPTLIVQEVGELSVDEGGEADDGGEPETTDLLSDIFGPYGLGGDALNLRAQDALTHPGGADGVAHKSRVHSRSARSGGGARSGDGHSAAGGTGGARSRFPRAVEHVFSLPLRVSDFFPYWDEVEVNDAAAGPTIAYDMIQQLSSSARRQALTLTLTLTLTPGTT